MGLPGLQTKRRSSFTSTTTAAAEEVPQTLHDAADVLRSLTKLLRSIVALAGRCRRSVLSALLHIGGESLDEVRCAVLRGVVALVEDVSALDKVRSCTVALLEVDITFDVANTVGLVVGGAVGVGPHSDLLKVALLDVNETLDIAHPAGRAVGVGAHFDLFKTALCHLDQALDIPNAACLVIASAGVCSHLDLGEARRDVLRTLFYTALGSPGSRTALVC